MYTTATAKRAAFIAGVVITVVLASARAFANTVDLGTHSASEIFKTCDQEGGTRTTSEGHYGCSKGDNHVVCSLKDDNCTGSCSKCGARLRGKVGVIGVLRNSPTRATLKGE